MVFILEPQVQSYDHKFRDQSLHIKRKMCIICYHKPRLKSKLIIIKDPYNGPPGKPYIEKSLIICLSKTYLSPFPYTAPVPLHAALAPLAHLFLRDVHSSHLFLSTLFFCSLLFVREAVSFYPKHCYWFIGQYFLDTRSFIQFN